MPKYTEEERTRGEGTQDEERKRGRKNERMIVGGKDKRLQTPVGGAKESDEMMKNVKQKKKMEKGTEEKGITPCLRSPLVC